MSQTAVSAAVFLEDIPKVYDRLNGEVDPVLNEMQSQLQQYRMFEKSYRERVLNLKTKVPDLEASLRMVKLLQSHKASESGPFHSTFELSDTLYVHGEAGNVDEVFLWLGADTMLAFPLDDAHDLLDGKIAAVNARREKLEKDLSWIKEQTTVTEVNISRLFNEAQKRRKLKE